MYFKSLVTVKPKSASFIQTVQPTKMFAKFLHTITLGLTSDKERIQTFTAVSILQKINATLRKKGIDNVVRLARDGFDFYLDESGKENDLMDAMREFHLNTDQMESELFSDLFLVLEHRTDNLRLLVEIDIKRVHAVDDPPINIVINGLIDQFSLKKGETQKNLKSRLTEAFSSSEAHQQLINESRIEFEAFVERLHFALTQCMPHEEITCQHDTVLLRPDSKHHRKPRDPAKAAPIHRDYHGYHASSLYTYLYLYLLIDCQIAVAELQIVADDGSVLSEVGESAISPAESTDPVYDFTQSTDDILTSDVSSTSSSGDSGSWLGDIGGGGDSGSSCGSGCGGGCGGG